MRDAVLRAAGSILVALSITLGAAGVALAASPDPSHDTLGASVSGQVFVDENPQVTVTNLGTVTTTFTAETPEGWTVTPASMDIAPGDSGKFTVGGLGDPGNVVVRGRMTGPSGGMDVSSIEFGHIALAKSRPFDPSRYVGTVVWALIILTGIVLLLWRVKPWRWRISVTRAGA